MLGAHFGADLHVNNWPLLIPCIRHVSAGEEPGALACASIRSFSCMPQFRRFDTLGRTSPLTAGVLRSIVSTIRRLATKSPPSKSNGQIQDRRGQHKTRLSLRLPSNGRRHDIRRTFTCPHGAYKMNESPDSAKKRRRLSAAKFREETSKTVKDYISQTQRFYYRCDRCVAMQKKLDHDDDIIMITLKSYK